MAHAMMLLANRVFGTIVAKGLNGAAFYAFGQYDAQYDA
jgi:hypothetical protein